MPRGKIAGFDRPLTESEIMYTTAVGVSDNYGMELENDKERAMFEEQIEELLLDNAERGRRMSVQASPAGSMVGIRVATGTNEIASDRTGNQQSIEAITEVMEMLMDEISEIEEFRVPSGVKRGFAEPVDEPMFTIRAV